MSELLKGKTVSEAQNIIDNYLAMLHGESYDEEVLQEANAFVNTSKQANRIKCATLSWNGIKNILDKDK
jgi:nitrogen fixation NifU-like protein